MKKLLLFSIVLMLNSNGYAQVNLDSLDAANEKQVSKYMEFLQKGKISLQDSSIWVIANMRKDHRFYGYEKPDKNSRKLILFSIFTNDVEGNPFKLPHAAYYETSGLKHKKLKFEDKTGNFIKAELWDEAGKNRITVMYFETKWFDFTKP